MTRDIKVMLILSVIVLLALFIQNRVYWSFIEDFENATYNVCTNSLDSHKYTPFCQKFYEIKYVVEPEYIRNDLIDMVFNKKTLESGV